MKVTLNRQKALEIHHNMWYNIYCIFSKTNNVQNGDIQMSKKNFIKAFLPALSAASAMAMPAMSAFASGDAAAGGTPAGGGATMLISLIVMFVLLYFLMIRPQRKKEKETKAMQDNIQIGDEIVTIGGIVGFVVRKGDDNVVIETGGEKNKMRIKLWAVSENTSALERMKEAQDKKSVDTGLASGKLKDEESEGKSKKKSKKNEENE